MRITKVLAVAATGCALAAAVAVPASAHPGHHAAKPAASKVFKTTISPKTGVKTGTTVTLKGTGALKNQTFTCVFIVSKKTDYAIGSIIGTTKSNSKGQVTCKGKFKSFKSSMTKSHVKTSCPVSKAQTKQGYKCALAVSNASQTDSGIGYFTAK